jgi:hypothetical protein
MGRALGCCVVLGALLGSVFLCVAILFPRIPMIANGSFAKQLQL